MRLPAFLRSPRLWGITGLSLTAYLLLVYVFGNIDISGLLPTRLAISIQTHWPDLPFFTVEKQTINGGKSQEVYYTVPTRQLTPREVAQLEAQGKKPKPKVPPTSSAAAR